MNLSSFTALGSGNLYAPPYSSSSSSGSSNKTTLTLFPIQLAGTYTLPELFVSGFTTLSTTP